jgi:hypothetical protein
VLPCEVALAPLWLGLLVEFDSWANDNAAQSSKADPKTIAFLIAVSPDLIFLPELRNAGAPRGCFTSHISGGGHTVFLVPDTGFSVPEEQGT